MSEARTLPYATDASRPASVADLAITVASTLAGVALLVAAGKGIAAVGNAFDLVNGCWQLLALRAAAGAAIVGSLLAIRRDQLAIFGIAYGAAMLASHAGWQLLMWCSIAGLAAWGVRTLVRSASGDRVAPFLAILLPTLTFLVLMTGGSFVRAIERGTVGSYAVDAMLRVVVTVLVVAGVYGAAKLIRRAMA